MKVILVDYSEEDHDSLEALIESCGRLVAGAADGSPSVFWAQSFGNLLATGVAGLGASVERFVMVSPFTRLPSWRVLVGTILMSLTPAFLYRATSRPSGRLLFGPVGGQRDHVFFEALARMTPREVRRRTSWLRSRDFSDWFARVGVPAKVWLGGSDRLVDLAEQKAFFRSLASRDGYFLSIIDGCGHVVLPAAAMDAVRGEIATWLFGGSPTAGGG